MMKTDKLHAEQKDVTNMPEDEAMKICLGDNASELLQPLMTRQKDADGELDSGERNRSNCSDTKVPGKSLSCNEIGDKRAEMVAARNESDLFFRSTSSTAEVSCSSTADDVDEISSGSTPEPSEAASAGENGGVVTGSETGVLSQSSTTSVSPEYVDEDVESMLSWEDEGLDNDGIRSGLQERKRIAEVDAQEPIIISSEITEKVNQEEIQRIEYGERAVHPVGLNRNLSARFRLLRQNSLKLDSQPAKADPESDGIDGRSHEKEATNAIREPAFPLTLKPNPSRPLRVRSNASLPVHPGRRVSFGSKGDRSFDTKAVDVSEGGQAHVVDMKVVQSTWDEMYEMIGGDEFYWLEEDSNQWTWKKFVQVMVEKGNEYAASVEAAEFGVSYESDIKRQYNEIVRRRGRHNFPIETIYSRPDGDAGVKDNDGEDVVREGSVRNSTADVAGAAFLKALVEHRGGVLDGTLLHYVCRLEPTNEVVEALIRASPDTVVMMADNEGFQPIQYIHSQLVSTLEARYTVLKDCMWDNFLEVFSTIQRTAHASTLVEMTCGPRDDTLLLLVLGQSRSPVPPHIIETLLEASREVVTMGNRDGTSPIHRAVQQNFSLQVIKMLIDADRRGYAIHASGQYGYTVLHLASKPEVSMDTVRLLLSSAPDKDRLVCREDKNGETALAHAIQRGAPKELIEELINADSSKVTLSMTDCFGKTPVCQAIKKGLPAEIVEIVMNSSPFEQVDALLRKVIGRAQVSNKFSPGRRSRGGRIARSSSMCSLADSNEGGDADDGVDEISIRYYECLAKYVCTSMRCQDLLNRRATDRIFTAVVMADFYAYALLVWGFSVSSHVAVQSWAGLAVNESSWYNTLYVLSGYLGLREVLQWKTQGINWLLDIWNWLDVTNIILVAVCASLMKTGVETDLARYLIMATGAIVWMMLLTFLRSTFLPFSVFVTGVNNIVWKLIPFLVSSAIVLGAFVHMYYIDSAGTSRCYISTSEENDLINVYRGEESKFCSYESTFIKIYHMFVGGVDEYLFSNGAVEERNWRNQEDDMSYSTMWVSVLFGLLVHILLSNVIIVIVNESWDDVSRHGAEVFWEHRISFLSEVKTVGIRSLGVSNYRSGIDFTKALDRFACNALKRLFFGSLSAEDYGESMFDYMTSLQDDGFLMKTCDEWKLSKYDPRGKRNLRRMIIFLKVLHHITLFLSVCLMSIVGGVFTFGFLWPRNFRHFMFSISGVSDSEGTGEMSKEIRMIRKELLKGRDEKLLKENQKLKGTLSELTDEINEIKRNHEEKSKRLESKMDDMMVLLLKNFQNGIVRNDASSQTSSNVET